ncbi:hypothetical protein RI367_003111 [Sorochytrium milnesiophthora]
MRTLAVQSHVVSGYCGNKCAVFPLQVLGIDVDPVNTVQLSNHTGYPHVKGHRFDGEHLLAIYEGLRLNNLHLSYTHILAGYLGTPSLVAAIAQVVRTIKAQSPSALFVLDPVLGDHGRLYVAQELIPLYAQTLCPLADVVTPNQYEAEITDTESAFATVRALHALGCQHVVVTSLDVTLQHTATHAHVQDGSDSVPVPNATGEWLTLLCSSSPHRTDVHTVTMPKLTGRFTGTGDMFAALVLGYMATAADATTATTTTTPNALHLACARAVWVLQHALQLTCQARQSAAAASLSAQELQVIRSKPYIEQAATLLPHDLQRDGMLRMGRWAEHR